MYKNIYGEFGSQWGNYIGGGILSTLIAIGIVIAVLIFVALYIYFALSWMKIAKKFKYKNAWFAWIPILNIAMMLQLGGFHWAWIFLIFVPFFGWIPLAVIVIIATWRIFERCDYPGWFSLSIIIPDVGWILYLVAIGFVAWSNHGVKVTIKKKARRKSRR